MDRDRRDDRSRQFNQNGKPGRRDNRQPRDTNSAPKRDDRDRSRSPPRRDQRNDKRRDRSPPRVPARSGGGPPTRGGRDYNRPNGDRGPPPPRQPNDARSTATAPRNPAAPRPPPPQEIPEDEDSEAEMARIMGFKDFRTTKDTKVPGNERNYGVSKARKTEYRQYMNRVGGFNRPLSPGRG